MEFRFTKGNDKECNNLEGPHKAKWNGGEHLVAMGLPCRRINWRQGFFLGGGYKAQKGNEDIFGLLFLFGV